MTHDPLRSITSFQIAAKPFFEGVFSFLLSFLIPKLLGNHCRLIQNKECDWSFTIHIYSFYDLTTAVTKLSNIYIYVPAT